MKTRSFEILHIGNGAPALVQSAWWAALSHGPWNPWLWGSLVSGLLMTRMDKLAGNQAGFKPAWHAGLHWDCAWVPSELRQNWTISAKWSDLDKSANSKEKMFCWNFSDLQHIWGVDSWVSESLFNPWWLCLLSVAGHLFEYFANTIWALIFDNLVHKPVFSNLDS